MKPKEQPLVSIIIPCYNSEQYVAAAIQSCLNQTYVNLEIIVINDGSTDGSLIEIEKFHPEIQIYSQENKGAQAARNFGICEAEGEFIQLFDADDLMGPLKIEKCLAAFEPDVDVVYCGIIDFGYTKRCRYQNHPFYPLIKRIFLKSTFETGIVDNIDDTFCMLLGQKSIQTSQPLYRESVFREYGMFDESLLNGHEVEFNCRIALQGACFKGIDDMLIRYRIHDSPHRIGNRSSGSLESLKAIQLIKNRLESYNCFSPRVSKLLQRRKYARCKSAWLDGFTEEAKEFYKQHKPSRFFPVTFNPLFNILHTLGGFSWACRVEKKVKLWMSKGRTG